MSLPTPLKSHGGYWRTSWRDEDGERRWASFGNAKKVAKSDATAKYEAWLHAFHTNDAIRNPARAAQTVQALASQYQAHADAYYRRPDGVPTREAVNIKHALSPVLDLCGSLAAADFTPSKLRLVREAMIASGLCRNTINKRIAKVRHMFKWAVEEELVPPSTWHGLQAVGPLKIGRTKAIETKSVKPVPAAHIEKVRPLVPVPVLAMIDLQLLTGMRPGEVRIMRGADLDTSGATWLYRPEYHKTQHHGKDRCIVLGPKSQSIVRPYLVHALGRYLFRSDHHKASQPCYTRDAYYQAVMRACKRAGVPRWSPGQLRHNAATTIRKTYGLEAAKVILGHSKIETTQVYAEVNLSQAREIMEAVG